MKSPKASKIRLYPIERSLLLPRVAYVVYHCSLQCPKLGQGWLSFTATIHSELSVDANGINGSMWSWVKDFEELVYTLVCFAALYIHPLSSTLVIM